MFISVVIPAYNEERYLGRCLRALRNQNYPHPRYEVIVVDNGSTDSTAEIARSYGARVVRERRKGVAWARQRGALAARGEVIAFTDADTIVPPHWVARIAARFAADPSLGGLYGPVYFGDGHPHERLIMKYPVTWGLAVSNLIGRTCWAGSSFAVHKDTFWKIGGFSGFDSTGLVGEDVYLSLRLSQVTKIAFDSELAVHTSARRAREGYLNFLRRTAVSTARVTLFKRPPLPMPDIR